MKADTYIVLKEKISELNKLNDEINLIEWNKDDEPKFTSVEEMKVEDMLKGITIGSANDVVVIKKQ